jgi:hypothetical protein
MKELIGENIEWNETTEISLSFSGVTGEKKEKRYYFVDGIKYKETLKNGFKLYNYILIALDGTGKKTKVDSYVFETNYKKGDIKIVSNVPTIELTL